MPTNYLITRNRIDDLETPVSAMLKLDPNQEGSFLFESVLGGERRGRYSFLGLRPDMWWGAKNGKAYRMTRPDFATLSILSTSDNPLNDLRKFVAEAELEADAAIPSMAAGAFGMMAYDLIRYFETLPAPKTDVLELPDALLMRPQVVIVFDSVTQDMLLSAPVHLDAAATQSEAEAKAEELLDEIESLLDSEIPRSAKGQNFAAPNFQSNTSKEAYLKTVEKVKDYIKAGDIFQAVPSQRFSGRFEASPFAFYRALRRINPSPYMFYLNFGSFQAVGASPEILVRVQDGRITIRPIAGTRPRGHTPERDLENEKELMADEKELAEHLMLLDLGRNDVGRFAAPKTVEVTDSFFVERYSHVMHIVSNVEGELRADSDAVSALMAGLPAGTVSGAPKIRAMEIINELEPEKRGLYAGGIGYFGWNGDLDSCIALRTAVIKGGHIYIQAGGGVVYDSDPEAEYQETLDKAGALFKAAEQAGRFS